MSIDDSSTKTGLAALGEFEDDDMRDSSTVGSESVIKNADLKIPDCEWLRQTGTFYNLSRILPTGTNAGPLKQNFNQQYR